MIGCGVVVLEFTTDADRHDLREFRTGLGSLITLASLSTLGSS